MHDQRFRHCITDKYNVFCAIAGSVIAVFGGVTVVFALGLGENLVDFGEKWLKNVVSKAFEGADA